MAANNMHNLTTLIKRLEAATSRLEDIASSTYEPGQSSTAETSTRNASLTNLSVPKAPAAAPAPTPAVSLPTSIEEFDEILKTVKAWKEKSAKLNPVLGDQASAVVQAFEAQRQFLFVATKAKKPDVSSSKYLEILRDLQSAIEKVDQVRQASRALDIKDHLAMVGDGVGALGWVTVDTSPKPADYVTELFGGAQIFGNKILKKKEPEHVEWIQGYSKIYKDLAAYVKKFHERGVVWNNKDGIDAVDALKALKAEASNANGTPAAAGGPPPPPPPPPLPTFDGIPPPPGPTPPGPAPKPKASGGDMGAVFDQLNRGSEVTKGLRKVDQEEMTHKNPSLRTSAIVPEKTNGTSPIARSKSPAPPPKKPKPESLRSKKPPKKELDGQKWIIENFDSPSEMIEIEASLTQSVLITKCNNATIRIVGKANAISIDNSSRASLVVDSLVSAIDVIKCPNVAIQVLGVVPTVLLDQVDGATIYLSKDSLETELFTSKCSSINVNLPPENEAGDYTEHPAPEQIRTYIKNGKLISEIVEHAG